MKAALRALVMKQEAFWAEHGSYTADMSALGLYPRPASADGTPAVQVIFAGSRGWTGMATQSTMKGMSCVILVGNPDELPKLPATTSSERDGRWTWDVRRSTPHVPRQTSTVSTP